MHIETVFRYQQRELLQLARIARRRWWITRYILAAIVAAGALVPAWPAAARVAIATCGAVTALLTEATLQRAAYTGAKHEVANAPRTYEITDESFVSRQGAVTRSLNWAEMHSVKRKGEWWYLHTSETAFTMFPVRALTSGQRTEFEGFLASKGWATVA